MENVPHVTIDFSTHDQIMIIYTKIKPDVTIAGYNDKPNVCTCTY